jgi:hypothetical protein
MPDPADLLFRAPDQSPQEIAGCENREAQFRLEDRPSHEMSSVEGQQKLDAALQSRGEHMGILRIDDSRLRFTFSKSDRERPRGRADPGPHRSGGADHFQASWRCFARLREAPADSRQRKPGPGDRSRGPELIRLLPNPPQRPRRWHPETNMAVPSRPLAQEMSDLLCSPDLEPVFLEESPDFVLAVVSQRPVANLRLKRQDLDFQSSTCGGARRTPRGISLTFVRGRLRAPCPSPSSRAQRGIYSRRLESHVLCRPPSVPASPAG